MAVQELIVCLDRMILIHEKLIEFSQLKKKLIVANRVDELSKMLVQEARCMRLVEEEDSRRSDAITRFLFEKGIRLQGRMSVSEVAKLVNDPQQKERLLKTATRLTHSIRQLKELNALNQLLIQQSLQFIAHGLDLMLGVLEDEPTYRKPALSAYEQQRKAVFERRT